MKGLGLGFALLMASFACASPPSGSRRGEPVPIAAAIAAPSTYVEEQATVEQVEVAQAPVREDFESPAAVGDHPVVYLDETC